MKIRTLIFLIFFLFSCNSENIENKKITEVKEGKIKVDETIILEELNKKLPENEKILLHYKTNKKITEKWKKEKIGKINCESGSFVLNDSEEKMGNFRENKEKKYLQKKVDHFNDMKYITGGFTKFVSEYCKNKESSKYVFWTQDKPIFIFGRYDKDLDIIEPAVFKYKTFDYIGGFYSDFKGFGKRIGNKILINDFARPIRNPYNKELQFFLKEKNKKYCYNGLTSKGNKAICFVDIYYSYDFVENILTEDKICTYYIDDDGKRKTLESCKEFNYN